VLGGLGTLFTGALLVTPRTVLRTVPTGFRVTRPTVFVTPCTGPRTPFNAPETLTCAFATPAAESTAATGTATANRVMGPTRTPT
jgi:hypothetical protein